MDGIVRRGNCCRSGGRRLQLRLGRQQAANEFEQRYIDRYFEFKDAGNENFLGSELSRRRYVRFCEDEYEPARSGRLRRRSWAMWHPAIVEKLAGFPPRERRWIPELTKERTLRRSLVSLCAEADLASSEPHDAHDCPAFYAPLTKDGASGGLLAEASRA